MNQKERKRLNHELAKPKYAALMKFYPLTVDDLPDEIWKPVVGFEDRYHVSNYGRTKSFCNGEVKIKKPSLCNGYLRVVLFKDGKRNGIHVHRLVAEAFIPNPEGKPQVNHIDGHKLNNFVDNLEWATARENIQHSFDTGLQVVPKGEDNHMAKLTNEQVEYIRNNPDGLTGVQLAEKFGVSEGTISDIQMGRKYKAAGGVIRKPQKQRLSDEVRAQIRAKHKKGVKGCGCGALGKEFGVDSKTIWKVVNEQ